MAVDYEKRKGRPCLGNGGQDRRVGDAGAVVADDQRVRRPQRVGEALGQSLVLTGARRLVGFLIEAQQDPIAGDDAILAGGPTCGGPHVVGVDAVAVQTTQQCDAEIIVADHRHKLGAHTQSRQIRGRVGGGTGLSGGVFDIDDRDRAFPGQAPARPGQPHVEHTVSEHDHARW